jgi:hypothetical protein
LDDFIGDEIDCLPPNLEKLYIKFHKKAKSAAKFYQIALQSTTLKQCYLIGGYAFDHKTCSHISSTTIEQLHMAIKSFPNDLIALLQALPGLTKLKSINFCLLNFSKKLFFFFYSSNLYSIIRMSISLFIYLGIDAFKY